MRLQVKPSVELVLLLGLVLVAPALDAYELQCQPEGVVTSIAGSGASGFRDGLREKAYLSSPAGLAVDSLGNMFVADSGNHRIRRVSANGDVTSVAGRGSHSFTLELNLSNSRTHY
jgi:hypothetical protein